MKAPFLKTSAKPLDTAAITAIAKESSVKIGSTFSRKGAGNSQVGIQAFAPLYHDLLYNNIGQFQTPRAKQTHNKLMRQIYDFDPIAGPAIDLYSDLPWSSFDIGGISDPAILHIYEDALNNLKLEHYLPQITANYLVYGRICLHFLFDAGPGVWTNFILHDDDDIRITPVPLLNEDPLVDLMPSASLKAFIMSKDERAGVYKDMFPGDLIDKIERGEPIPMDNSNTLYLPRRSMASDHLGTSMFSRIIGLITLERALFNASVSRAQRSAGTIRILKMGRSGIDGWLPTDEEVTSAVTSLMMAEEDPVASIVGFKTSDVTVESIAGSGQDALWKISDENSYIEAAKMKALGLSETMLSGDATYNNLDTSLSIFLEKVKTMRDFFTRKIIIERVFEPLAKAHGFYQKDSLTKGRSLQPRGFMGGKIQIKDVSDSKLILPTIQWTKPLEPRMDSSLIELLDKAEEKGLPITLRKWATATGQNISEIQGQVADDIKLRKEFAEYQKQKESIGQEAPSGDEDLSEMGPLGEEPSGPEETPSGPDETPMQKVEAPPEGESLIENVPPPPEPSSVRPEPAVITKPEKLPTLKQIKSHPLMNMAGTVFGGVPTERIEPLINISDQARNLQLSSWDSNDRAVAKFALHYIGSNLKLSKREIIYIAKLMKKTGKMKGTALAEHGMHLHLAGEDAAYDLLTGKL